MLNRTDDTAGFENGVKVLGVDNGGHNHDEDNDCRGKSSENGQCGDFAHCLGHNNRNCHNGSCDHDPLLHCDGAANRGGQILNVGSGQNQVKDGPTQGDRVVEEGDQDAAGQAKGSSGNIGVLSQAGLAIRKTR